MKYPKVSAITLNWNQKGHTVECVESLKRLDYPDYGIIVVDNASTDGSVPLLREMFPDITVIQNKKNLGYAEGFNTGIRHAFEKGADYFLILNNDTAIDKDALKELIKVAENDPMVGLVSGKVYFYDRPDVLQTVGKQEHPITIVGRHIGMYEADTGQYDDIKERSFVDDVFLLVRRDVFQKVGGYDSNFFLYYEETDWCARVRREGFKIIYTPAAKIWHKEHSSTGGAYNPIIDYYMARNRILFVRRNASTARFLIFLFTLIFIYTPITIALNIKRRKFRLIPAYMKGLWAGFLWLITPRM
jgi:GT2 family glycosyltransferase